MAASCLAVVRRGSSVRAPTAGPFSRHWRPFVLTLLVEGWHYYTDRCAPRRPCEHGRTMCRFFRSRRLTLEAWTVGLEGEVLPQVSTLALDAVCVHPFWRPGPTSRCSCD